MRAHFPEQRLVIEPTLPLAQSGMAWIQYLLSTASFLASFHCGTVYALRIKPKEFCRVPSLCLCLLLLLSLTCLSACLHKGGGLQVGDVAGTRANHHGGKTLFLSSSNNDGDSGVVK